MFLFPLTSRPYNTVGLLCECVMQRVKRGRLDTLYFFISSRNCRRDYLPNLHALIKGGERLPCRLISG